MLKGARAVGWGQLDVGDGTVSGLLAEQDLTLLSGYDASVTRWEIWGHDGAHLVFQF